MLFCEARSVLVNVCWVLWLHAWFVRSTPWAKAEGVGEERMKRSWKVSVRLWRIFDACFVPVVG